MLIWIIHLVQAQLFMELESFSDPVLSSNKVHLENMQNVSII